MSRPNINEYFMQMALLVASRSTCLRRSVGCVLVNDRKHVLSTGYNGVAAGMPHCNDREKISLFEYSYAHACAGAERPSGEGLDYCQAIHAEQNALLQCRDVYTIHTCYTTTLPCLTCVKLLMNTSCERIVYAETYPHEVVVRDLCAKRGIELVQVFD